MFRNTFTKMSTHKQQQLMSLSSHSACITFVLWFTQHNQDTWPKNYPLRNVVWNIFYFLFQPICMDFVTERYDLHFSHGTFITLAFHPNSTCLSIISTKSTLICDLTTPQLTTKNEFKLLNQHTNISCATFHPNLSLLWLFMHIIHFL